MTIWRWNAETVTHAACNTWLPPDWATRYSPSWCWHRLETVPAGCRACHEAAVAAWDRRWAQIRAEAIR